MKIAVQSVGRTLVAIAIVACWGCPLVPAPDGPGDAATPAPCTTNQDCPDGIACVFPNGTDPPGFCDVDETEVTTGTPAPCNTDEECPEGIGCIFPDGPDQAGFCDIEEMQGP